MMVMVMEHLYLDDDVSATSLKYLAGGGCVERCTCSGCAPYSFFRFAACVLVELATAAVVTYFDRRQSDGHRERGVELGARFR